MRARRKQSAPTRIVREWKLSAAATLGSSVRARGIMLEVRAQLPIDARKLLDVEAGNLALRVPEDATDNRDDVAKIVAKILNGIENLPVIPREVEDILSISSGERLRWLKDGRLQSVGTRTVKLRGRASKITFHVFDPRHIEDVLDRDLASVWREDDAQAAADNRRRAAAKAALTRARKKDDNADTESGDASSKLQGWDDFDIDGLLR